MNPLTQEWVDKAEEDWSVLNRELRARKSPGLSAVCFHAQQCAEKYLKGRLQEAMIGFPRTHDLLSLLTLAVAVEPSWTHLQSALDTLNDYAVNFRYPGHNATRDDAKKLCQLVRNTIRPALGLPL